MEVYTFSTGDIYLEKLSKTKQGVKDLLKPYVEEYYLDNSQEVVDISILDNYLIKVTIYDNDLEDRFVKEFDLVSFSVF